MLLSLLLTRKGGEHLSTTCNQNVFFQATVDKGKGHQEDDNEPPLRARDPFHSHHTSPPPTHHSGPPPPSTRNTPLYDHGNHHHVARGVQRDGPPPSTHNTPLYDHGNHHHIAEGVQRDGPHPPHTLDTTIASQDFMNDGRSLQSNIPIFPTEFQHQAPQMHPQASQYTHSPHNVAPLQYYPLNQQSYPTQPPYQPSSSNLPRPPPKKHSNQPQNYPHSSNTEIEKDYSQFAGNIENYSPIVQPLYPNSSESGYMSRDSNVQSDLNIQPPPLDPHQTGAELNTPSKQIEIENPNSTKLLIVRNTLQEDIDRGISEAAEGVTMVTKNESEREGAPLDPNLVCPMCMKQYRIGEIQLFRAHVGKCDGTRQ